MITPPSTFRFCTGAPRYDDWLVMIRAARGRNPTSSRMAAHLRDWGRRNPRCRRRWAQRSTSARLADHCPQLIKHWCTTAPSSGLVRSRTLRCLPNVASGTGQGRGRRRSRGVRRRSGAGRLPVGRSLCVAARPGRRSHPASGRHTGNSLMRDPGGGPGGPHARGRPHWPRHQRQVHPRADRGAPGRRRADGSADPGGREDSAMTACVHSASVGP